MEDGRIRRLGGEREIEVDVQIFAASNRDLRARVDEGAFREDLFHRLTVLRLQLPPLRRRMEDLKELVWAAVAERLEGAAIDLTEASRQALEGTLGPKELGRVSARALLAVSEHHRELTGAALADHKPALGSIHLAEATHQLENAYVAAGVEMDAASREALAGARALVKRLEGAGPDMTGIQADTALVVLARDARRLEYALGARRR